MTGAVKLALAHFFISLGIDRVGRSFNRRKLLVVMYHGITRQSYDPPVWTQLPQTIFRRHLEFIACHYYPVSLGRLMETLDGGPPLPERAVLITFDDGLRNNATVAWPILKEFGIPATIFLATDFIGTKRFLWVDELYIILAEGARHGIRLPLKDSPPALNRFHRGDVWGAYVELVEAYKRTPESERTERLLELKAAVPLDGVDFEEDFGLLDWSQVQAMARDGLIDFGAHTATHKILTQMEPNDMDHEIIGSKETIQSHLGRSVEAFCYPNGRPGIDFSSEHREWLRQAGYQCAFTTRRALFNPGVDDPFTIGRIPAGHDTTSHPEIFRWNCAGLPG